MSRYTRVTSASQADGRWLFMAGTTALGLPYDVAPCAVCVRRCTLCCVSSGTLPRRRVLPGAEPDAQHYADCAVFSRQPCTLVIRLKWMRMNVQYRTRLPGFNSCSLE